MHLDPQHAPLDAALHLAPVLAPLTTLAGLFIGRIIDFFKGGCRG